MTKQQWKRNRILEITFPTKYILGQSKNLEVSENSHIFVASFQPLVFAYSALTLFTANIIIRRHTASHIMLSQKDCITRAVFCSF